MILEKVRVKSWAKKYKNVSKKYYKSENRIEPQE